MPDGKESDFYVKKEGPAVAVLAITKDNEVILVRQFRPGPKEILNELPGGYIDQKETPEEAGLRELKEETGYSGKARLAASALDCAYSTMERFCIVVTDCEKISDPQPGENEFVQTVLLSIEDFRKLLKSGKMTDIEVGYLCLDFLGLL